MKVEDATRFEGEASFAKLHCLRQGARHGHEGRCIAKMVERVVRSLGNFRVPRGADQAAAPEHLKHQGCHWPQWRRRGRTIQVLFFEHLEFQR